MKTESRQKPDSSRRSASPQPEKPKELYLKIPYHILNIPEIGLPEKVLLAHFYSFGKKGCWQSNATLAKMFMTSPATISRWVTSVRKFIHIKCPKGYYRTVWVKSHPDVASRLIENDKHVNQNCVSDFIKSAIPLTQKCATTNNNTIKETIEDTTATPAPLPAGGQAPALLADRKAQMQAQIEQFKRKFGIGKEKRRPPSPEEFEQKRHKVLEQLRMPRESKLLQTCATTAVSDTKIKDDTI